MGSPVLTSRLTRTSTRMIFRNSSEIQVEQFFQSLANLPATSSNLEIVSKNGNLSYINRELLCLFSPSLRSILKNLPCCSGHTIIIPDVSKESIEYVISLLASGVTHTNAISIHQIQKVQEAAKMIGVDLTNIDCDLGLPNIAKSEVEGPNKGLDDSELFVEAQFLNHNELLSLEEASHRQNKKDLEHTNEENFNNVVQLLYKNTSFNAELISRTLPKQPLFRRMKSMKRGAMFVAHDAVRKGFEILHKI